MLKLVVQVKAWSFCTHLSWALVLEVKLEIGINMHIQSKLL